MYRHAGPDQRNTTRYDYPSTIEYHLEASSPGEVHKAVTINISRSGLGAYLFAPHAEGQRIRITSPLPVDCRIATVRWVRQEDRDFFLAGLRFDDCGHDA
jgi:hypothetical protein